MSLKENIQTLFREIEVYNAHGLFDEAKVKCDKLAKLIRQSNRIKNKQDLLDLVAKKVGILEEGARRTEVIANAAEMTEKQQELVKDVFSSGTGESESAAMEGATALLMFGQFEKALSEFTQLLEIDALRVAAAKNIIRCHVGLSSLDDAVDRYNQWLSGGRFPSEGLRKLRAFLQNVLKKRGMDTVLPKPEEVTVVEEDEVPEEEFIDVLSIEIPSKDDSRTMLDVRYQKGNLISVIIPPSSSTLLDSLKVGSTLNDVQFYSPAVVFTDTCVVSAKNRIKSGPKKGDYSLVLKILNI